MIFAVDKAGFSYINGCMPVTQCFVEMKRIEGYLRTFN